MKKGEDWTPHDGGPRPKTGSRKVLVRLRCRTRSDVESSQKPEVASWWKNWRHTGSPGDIVEWRYA